MKKITITILLAAFLITTPSCITTQIKGDSEITAIAEVALGTIAQVIKRDHKADIDTIIKYCDEIIAQEDSEVVQEMFLFGYDYLVDKYINDDIVNAAVKSIGRLFRVDLEKDFDGGEIRLAKDFAGKLKELLK